MTRRSLLNRAGAAGLLLAMPGVLAACGSSSSSSSTSSGEISGTIDYFGWEYEDFRQANAAFVKKHNLKVKTQAMAAFKDPIAKVKSGAGAGIDVFGTSNSALPAYNDAGIIQTVTTDQAPNLANLFPQLLDAPGLMIDGEFAMIPTYWSLEGLTRNVATVPKPFTSWTDVLDPSLKGRVGAFNDPDQFQYAIAPSLGYAPGKIPKSAKTKANDYLNRVVDQLKSLTASYGDMITQLDGGEIDVAFPGFINYKVYMENVELTTDIDLKEGVVVFVDGLVISSEADNAEAAIAYGNNLLEPKVNASAADSVAGAVAVPKAVPFQDKSVRSLYPYNDMDSLFSKALWYQNLPDESDEYLTDSEWLEMYTQATA